MIDQQRLHNWGRCFRVYKFDGRGQAWSAEGNFRNRDDDGLDALTRPGKLPSPDVDDAWNLEVACRLLPIKHHVLLKLRYVVRLSDDHLAKAMRTEFRMRMSTSDIDAAEGMAMVLLEENLHLPAVIRMERAQAAVRRILQLYPVGVEEVA